MQDLTIDYTTYIATTPKNLWDAMTNPVLTAQWWRHRVISEWQVGSSWEHQSLDDAHTANIQGSIVEIVPQKRLVYTWIPCNHERRSQVSWTIEAINDKVVKLALTHEGIVDEMELKGTISGWAKVLSNLKSFLETTHTLPGLW